MYIYVSMFSRSNVFEKAYLAQAPFVEKHAMCWKMPYAHRHNTNAVRTLTARTVSSRALQPLRPTMNLTILLT